LAAGLALGFIAISVWWVLVDERIPNGDNGKHIVHAFMYFDEFQAGHWLAPLFNYTQYPPLVHVVGAFASLIFGPSIATVVIAENAVFVPLLALGVYKSGSLVFGRTAGLLAVVFVFAAPMVMSLFHVFMLDAPAAALAAVSVWLLLASRRFESLPYAAGAAVAVAAGMYIKTTFVFFVAGLIIALIARGGWRNWRTLAVAGGVFLILVEPWYFIHFQVIRGLTTGALNVQGINWYGDTQYPTRWSVRNFTWYAWNLINTQLYVPLTLCFLLGVVSAVVLWLRDRERESYVPELLAGLAVSYIGISLLSLDDPRYTLPMLVYLAVFATGWIPRVGTRVRLAAVAALVAILVLNTALLNLVGGQHSLRWELPGAPDSPIGEREFTFASNSGYIEGKPKTNGIAPRFIDMLKRARDDGARQVVFQPESMNNGGYNLFGLAVFARTAGLAVPGNDWSKLGPEDVYVFRLAPKQAGRPPCLISSDGTGIYMVKGQPSAENPVYCPPSA
jgi:4-amino-4-deoxy-L-arabinose transferase-like glycosyltransferase